MVHYAMKGNTISEMENIGAQFGGKSTQSPSGMVRQGEDERQGTLMERGYGTWVYNRFVHYEVHKRDDNNQEGHDHGGKPTKACGNHATSMSQVLRSKLISRPKTN